MRSLIRRGGQQRVANGLRLKGHEISPGGVRSVWLRHELETRHKRLLRLETVSQSETIVLSEEQMQLLERCCWPPDVFAVAVILLEKSGAYVHAPEAWPPVSDGNTVIARRTS